jgi:hypothetical protein
MRMLICIEMVAVGLTGLLLGCTAPLFMELGAELTYPGVYY